MFCGDEYFEDQSRENGLVSQFAHEISKHRYDKRDRRFDQASCSLNLSDVSAGWGEMYTDNPVR